MTILLTGGSGFLGSHIAEQLSTQGRAVRALVRSTSDTSFLETLQNVELFEGAVGDAKSLERAVDGATAIIHSAGLVKAKRAEDFTATNTAGTCKLLEAAEKHGKDLRRFVLVSSLAAAGPSADGSPVAASATPSPVTHYGRSKLAAERAALAVKDLLPITIIRPPAIYGPRDREILAFFKAVKTGIIPSLGSDTNTLSMIYGADCASACIAAVDADVPSGSVFFVEDGRTYTVPDMLSEIERALGTRAWLKFSVPRGVVRSAAFMSEMWGKATNSAMMLTRDKCNELFAPHWVCDGDAARNELDWQPQVQFEEGARLTAEWYRDAGWL